MPYPYTATDFDGTDWTIKDGRYYVSTAGNDITGDGSPQDPFLTIYRALQQPDVLEGDKIVISPNEYILYNQNSSGSTGAALPCRVATTGNIASLSGITTIDGILLSAGDRVLVWQQSGPAQNGIYVVSSTTWTRDENFDSAENMIQGILIPISTGTVNGKSIFQFTTVSEIVIGTTPLTFEKRNISEWGGLKGEVTNQSDLLAFLNSPTSYDMTVVVGPNQTETSPKNACITVRTWLDSNPSKSGRILILEGIYEENEINQHEVDIWAEDGVIVWTAAPAKSIFSDRLLANDTKLRVFGKGVYVHASPTGSNDQQAINFRKSGADIYVQAKKIDMAQMWNNGFQQLVIEDCELLFPSSGVNRSNSRVTYRNCKFLNGFILSEYNYANSVFWLKNTEIVLPKKIGQVGMQILDKSGNAVLSVNNSWLLSNCNLNVTQMVVLFTGTSGGGDLVIEGINYGVTFNTDIDTTIEDFITAQSSALLATPDELSIFRVAGAALSGSSGSGTLTIDSNNFTIDFNIDAIETCKKFIDDESSNIAAIGVTVKNIEGDLIFIKSGGARPVVSYSNSSGDIDAVINNGQILISSVQETEFSVTYSNTGGNMDASITDYYSLDDLTNLVFPQNSTHGGYAGIQKSHYHASPGNDGRGHNLFVENVLIRLQKRKTIGLKLVPRVNEVPGNCGGVFINGLTIRDETGTAETVAVAQGYDANSITNPFKTEIKGLQQNCGSSIVLISGLSNIEISSNDINYNLLVTATPKGLLDCSTNPNYPAGRVGDYYYVSVTGKIGGASGLDVLVGIRIECIVSYSAGGDQATVGSEWLIVNENTAGNDWLVPNNLGLGSSAFGASASKVLAIANGVAPTSSPTDMVQLFAEDVSDSSELKVRDEAGNITTLSPHNFSLIPNGASEEMAWSYYSEKDGKAINIDMAKLARLVEKLTGEKLIFIEKLKSKTKSKAKSKN